MQITVELPDAIAKELSEDPGQRQTRLLLEIAVALYTKGTVSLTQGAAIAGVPRSDFGAEIGSRGIPRHYNKENLDEDLAYAGHQ